MEKVRKGAARGTEIGGRREGGCEQWCKDGGSGLKGGFLEVRREWELVGMYRVGRPCTLDQRVAPNCLGDGEFLKAFE